MDWNRPPGLASSSIQSEPSGASSISRIRLRMLQGCRRATLIVKRDDAIVDLRINRIFVQRDSVATCPAALRGFLESLNHIRSSQTGCVLQRDKEAAIVRRLVAVIVARPSVHVDHAIRRNNHVACVANAIGEYRAAEAAWQHQTSIV